MLTAFENRLVEYVKNGRDGLVETARELIRIPSENHPPDGDEAAVQRHIAASLGRLGWDCLLYELDSVSGLREHPLFRAGRSYANRPNLGVRRRGAGGGRSLVLSGHADTVPRGTLPWTRDAFGGEVEGNRLYGRGANDMKGGVASNMFVLRALTELEIELQGDLAFETVVDEEFGGVNGTLAGRVQGYNADAAIISEASFLRVCPAQRGGRTAHISLRGSGGILQDGDYSVGVIEQLRILLNRIPDFAARRKARVNVHPWYASAADPVPVRVMKVSTGPFTMNEPMGIPEVCRIELFWQAMPGETQQHIEAEFHAWLDGVIASSPATFARRPEVEFPLRWLPGSATGQTEPLVAELAACSEAVLGRPARIEGIEGPCDMYVFHEFGMPAVLWGARGGNTHGADEYVAIDSLVEATAALLVFVCRWCGVK